MNLTSQRMSVDDLCAFLNTAMFGHTDQLVDLKDFEPSVWVELVDFCRDIRVVFTHRKSKKRYQLKISDGITGTASEGVIRSVVMRSYNTAVLNMQSSTEVDEAEVTPFLQSVLAEAAVSLFAMR